MVCTFATTKDIWCVIPTSENSVREFAKDCRAFFANVLVVDTGEGAPLVADHWADTDITILHRCSQLGLGAAMTMAGKYVESKGGRVMITMDPSSPFIAEDAARFVDLIIQDADNILIGYRNHAVGSKLGHIHERLHDFLFFLETGSAVRDVLCPLRAYPVKYFNQLCLSGNGRDFLLDAAVRGAWAGLSIKSAPISGQRPARAKSENRLHIALKHARLMLRRLAPWPIRKLIQREDNYWQLLRKNPRKLLALLLTENSTPVGLGVSAGVGTFIAVLPLIGVHSIVIFYVTTRLNLNRIMALLIQNLCAPPFVPFFCIEIGYYLLNGHWLTQASRETVLHQWSSRLGEYLLGSLIVAPLLAMLIGFVIYLLAIIMVIARARRQ